MNQKKVFILTVLFCITLILFMVLSLKGTAIFEASTSYFTRLGVEPPISSTESSLSNYSVQPDLLKTEECLPNYSFLKEHLYNETGQQKTPFLLLSSFEYSDHVIVTLQSIGWAGTPVFCRYLDDNLMELGEAVSSVVFRLSVVHCCRRTNAKYISITLNKTQTIEQWTALNDRTIHVPKYNLSLCLAPIYGNESKWLMLAETIEHYKLQGVQHFYVYIKDMDVYSRYLVDDYIRSGEVEVVWFDYRDDRDPSDYQLSGVQECLMRARFHSKYAIFADIDERITPSNGNETLVDLVMNEFGNNNKTGGIRFRPRWILADKSVPAIYKGSTTLNESLPTMVFHNTSHWPYEGHTAKMILDPKKVSIMWVHWVDLYLPGYETVEIKPERAIIRHYRSLAAGDWGKIWRKETETFGKYEYTNYPEHLMERLYKNVLRRLNRVYSKAIPVT